MKKTTLALGALLALGTVVSFGQDAPRQQRGPRDGARPNMQRQMGERPNLKPTLFANLGDECYTPDGMTVSDETGMLYLNVPNFGRMDDKMVKADSAQGGYLYTVDKDGKSTRILEYPVLERTGQAGPMGLDFGPDGNLYVCDNQYFHNKDYCSRILRVVMKDGKATGEVQVVIEGVKLANGMTWFNDKLFYTDSCFDEEGLGDDVCGSGGVFMFTADEITKAGKDGNPAIAIKAGKDEAHCVAYAQVKKLGREDGTGPDGLCVDKNGVLWFGNFGNGTLYCLRPTDDGQYKQENVECVFDSSNQPERRGQGGIKLECCDGIFYDANLDCVYIDDSVNNAVWMFKPCKQGEKVRPIVMWTNDDDNGNEGLLDQPCEAVVYGDKLLFVNFDWPFPGMKNKTVDAPGTISAMDYNEVKKFVERVAMFQNRAPQGQRPQGQRNAQGDRPQGQRNAQGDRPQGQRNAQGDRPQGQRRAQGDRQGQRPQGDRPQNQRQRRQQGE